MGLPVFREAEVTDSKAPLKSDSSAYSRSSIRRGRPNRHTNNDGSGRRSEFWRRAIENQRWQSTRSSNPPMDYVSSRPLLRHALRNDRSERSSQRVRTPRESWLRYGVEDAPIAASALHEQGSRHDSADQDFFQTRSPAFHHLMSLRSSSVDHTRSPPAPANDIGDSSESSSLTPRFAPAYRLEMEESTPADLFTPPNEQPERDEPSPQPVERQQPSLRRIGHRSIANANRPPPRRVRLTFDGLGDRERSFSSEEDSWENLLTTIAPDEHLPSTNSSFTSAAATSFTSQPGSSVATQVTAPSTAPDDSELFFPNCDPSDSESTDTESDSSRTSLTLRRAASLRLEARSLTQEAERLRRTTRELDSQTRALSERRTDGPSSSVDSDPEVGQMRSILERLSRREDIPDEWWAAAGLTRSNVGSEMHGIFESLGGQLESLVARIDRLERQRELLR